MTDLDRELYRTVYLLRHAGEMIRARCHEDEMKTPMHMSFGAEAIAAGVCRALARTDQVFTSYRSHAAYLAKTDDVDGFFAELYAREIEAMLGLEPMDLAGIEFCSHEKRFRGPF